MKIVLFGGTTEGRVLSRKLAELGAQVLVSVATPLGQEEQGELPGVAVHCGRLTVEGMAALLADASLCIDATHPYAAEATRNIRAAAHRSGVELLRLLRSDSPLPEYAVVVTGAAEAAAYLAQTEGNILLTTGAKELAAYTALPPERLYPRVLPTLDGISACERLNIPHRNILALQGPFTRKMNEAMLEQYHIDILVTKDGGVSGGFAEKAEAARACGVRLVVLRRPEERGLTMEQVLTRCEERLQCN